MLSKILKTIIFLFIIFCFSVYYVFATDVNLQLPGTSSNITTNEENTTGEELLDEETSNTVDDTSNNIENTDDVANENSEESAPEDSEELLDAETIAPSDVSNSSAQSGLSTTNIINILLITVGVILVLLAIAILIRLKN